MKKGNESVCITQKAGHTILKIVVGVVLILVGIQLGYLFCINSTTNEVGIAGSSIKFKTPRYVITMINGKPDDKVKDEETGAVQYIYENQTLFGETGTISYQCLLGVNEVTAIIQVEPEQGKEKFYDICNYMSEVYSQKEGYYDEGVTEQNGVLECNLGAEFGATGITVTITCEEDIIKIVANYLY